jgi:hypothetical protein
MPGKESIDSRKESKDSSGPGRSGKILDSYATIKSKEGRKLHFQARLAMMGLNTHFIYKRSKSNMLTDQELQDLIK